MKISDRRNLIKRTDISGRTPTINTGSTYPETTWDPSDIMVGEIYGNVVDEKLWWRTENGLQLIGTPSGTTEFIDQTDTPSSYNSNGGSYLRVNTSEDAVEFYNPTFYPTFLSLTDTPSSFSGLSGYSVTVNDSESGLTFTEINRTFTGLTDVNLTSYTEDNILTINDSNNIISIDPSTLFVELSGNQDVLGEKTFENTSTFKDGINLNYPFVFSGNDTDVHTINRIVDTISGGTTNEIPTALAVLQYVNDSIYGTGSTDAFVTVDTSQTIEADKTFNDEVIFNSGVTFNETVELDEPILNSPNISGNTYNDMASYQYLGDETTNGSWRWFINPDGDLEFQKRESGTWVWKNTIK